MLICVAEYRGGLFGVDSTLNLYLITWDAKIQYNRMTGSIFVIFLQS